MSSEGGPGCHVLYRKISIPASFSAKFFAKVFVGNPRHQAGHSRRPPRYTVSPNRQARIEIMTTSSPVTDVGAGVLMNL